MPSCSGNHKQAPMTGGGIRSMLRRAKSGLRKLTKRSKPQTHAEEFQMVNLRPKVASTRFGSMKKKLPYVVPGHVESMENIANLQASQLSELEQQVAKLEKANEKCNHDLVYKGVELNKVTGEQNEMSRIHTKLEKEHKGTLKDLESAVAKLAECEAGKASGSRRRQAAAKMYRAAHVDRTLGALDTEDALANMEKHKKMSNEWKKTYDITARIARQQESKADAAIQKLGEVVPAAMSDRRRLKSTERKLASAERRKQQASSRAANLELESDVLKAQYAAAAERLENDTLKHIQELNHKNKLLAAARNQFADVETNRKLKVQAANLVKNNKFTRRLTVGVQPPKSSKKSNRPSWVTSGGHLRRG
jgi:chromosome segregation ATPase